MNNINNHLTTLTIIFICLFTRVCFADSSLIQLGINGNEDGISIHRSTYYFIDPESKFSAEQISKSTKLKSYAQLLDSNNSIKATQGSVWTRVVLTNTLNSEISINLEYPFNQPSTAFLYYRPLNSQQAFTKIKSDMRESNRPVPIARLTFPLTLKAKEIKEVILETYSDVTTPRFTEFRVWSNKSIMKASNIEHMAFGIVTCFLIVAAFISAVIYQALKENFFIWFSLFALSSVPVLGLTTGILNLYIPNLDYHPLGTIFVVMMIASFIQFLRTFIDVAKHSVKADKALHFFIIFILATIPIAIIGFHEVATHIQQIGVLLFPLTIIIAIYCGVKGEQLITSTIISIFIFSATLFSITPQTWDWVTPSYGIIFLPTLGFFTLFTFLLLAMFNKSRLNFEIAPQENVEKITTAYKRAFAMQEQAREKNQQLMEAKEQAEFEARTDMLTHLPNRRAFMNLAKIAIAQAHRQDMPLAFIAFDIDNFKQVNDKYGHPAGDETLKVIASQIRQVIRASDFCGRIGGEEFMIGCHNNSAEDAQHIAERLRRKISETIIYFDGLKFSTTVSIGIANVESDDDLDSLIKKSDMAMYNSKTTGKNRVSLYAA